MISWHRIGQKIVCITEEPWYVRALGFTTPEHGKIYTIRAVECVGGRVGFLLDEIRNPVCNFSDGVGEAAWSANQFKPVRETDISCFKAILRQVNDSVPA